ncbi:choice-of-anchor Q domain-containing protein (plasmid) [Nostoc sp. UHCC 0302]|uniref:choice-of-anchor Q domain-containing protein n=1 Tax=Nostoc sp. UHCC 0302 TaxID=3134896 RepID=UPI00311C8AC2
MATFNVTNTNDSGTGSLRQAILNANALTGKDLLNFNGVFADSIADTITLGGSSLTITDDLTINGTGANLLTVSGNNNSRVFEINSGTTAEIVGLTIANGYIFEDFPGGAGILNSGTLTLSNSIVNGNIAESASGGGIFNSGTLKLSDTTISNNRSQGYYGAGGIYNSGTLIVDNSNIKSNSGGEFIGSDGSGGIFNSGTATLNNSTISNNGARFGGGIYNASGTLTINKSTVNGNGAEFAAGILNDGILTLSDSTISDNSADGTGGGISNGGTLTIINSTLSDNSATAEGGGIINGGTLTIINSTLSGNSANLGAGIYNFQGLLTVSNSTITLNNPSIYESEAIGGGGIYIEDGTITVNNSIIAGNFYTPDNGTINVTNPDVVGDFISNGYNLIGNLNGSTGFNTSEQLTVPITEVLDLTLRDNGGATKTHALVTGSKAINAGNNADIPADIIDIDSDGNTTEPVPYDQRGRGFVRVSGGRVDIGAYEAQVNVINGTSKADTLIGTSNDDIITGFKGRDTFTGGSGADAFTYTSIQDAGDTITDFQSSTDKIVLRQLFQSFNLPSLNYTNAIAKGYLQFASQGSNTVVLIDPDGTAGKGRAVKLVTVENVSTSALNKSVNFAF